MNIKWLKIIGLLMFLLTIIMGVVGYWGYRQVYEPNVYTNTEVVSLYLEPNTTLDELTRTLTDSNYLRDVSSFRRVAGWMSFSDQSIKPGHYQLENKWSNRRLLNTLRSGTQTPVQVILNNERSLMEIAGTTSGYLMPDSQAILDAIRDPRLYDSLNIPRDAALTLFIPNTYEFYWDTSPAKFTARMVKEYQRFWSDSRKQKCQELDLDPTEVYILASIVERETLKNEEKKRIAGVYLNRLKRGILLQADPTVVFATGDFSIARVLNKHLAIDSPYNTYLYAGLPPGPICMPSINSIDAVLNAESHDYLYFCARADKPGYHAFARTLAGHNRNARKYQAWLSQKGIR